MAWHKSRGICFGGVHDVEDSEEGIESEFFDQLLAWNVDRNRFFPLTLRRPRAGAVGKGGQQGGEKGGSGKRGGRGRADEEELLANLARLEASGGLGGGGGEEMDVDVVVVKASQGVDDEEDDERKKEVVVLNTMPHPRFNAQLAVQEDSLYIFGGTYEHGEREYTFDEMFSIDLGKLDGVKQLFKREVENWVESEESDEEGSDEEEGDESDEAEGSKMDVEDQTWDKMDLDEPREPATPATSIATDPELVEPATPTAHDNRPYPRPFESLRDFYARTSTEWQELVIQDLRESALNAVENSSIKELKKKGFDRAEERWWDVREEVMAMEDEQERAGIGEVVSLGASGERKDGSGGAGGGGGRRR